MAIASRVTEQTEYLAKTFPGKNRKYVSEAFIAKLFDELFDEALDDLEKNLNTIVLMKGFPDTYVRRENLKAAYAGLLETATALQPLHSIYSFALMPKKSALDIVDYATFLVEHAR